MEKGSGWRYITAVAVFLIAAVLSADFYLRTILSEADPLLSALRLRLYLGGLGLFVFFSLLLTAFYFRLGRPINKLADNLKEHLKGDQKILESLHQPSDIGPLLYAIEILLNSLDLQIKDAESEAEILRTVLDLITDGIVMINERGDIISLNPAAEEIFQIKTEKAQGRTVAEVLRQFQWIELYRTCLETQLETSATVEIPSQKVFLQGFAIPLSEVLPGYILMLFQDLSQLRRLETTRQDFISNLSHELRTPLASLKALSETLQEGALEDPEAARRFLGRMETEVDALTQMVSELLELSRIESGRVPLDLKLTSPGTLLSRSFERMRTQADRKNLEIEIQTQENLPRIQVDPRRVEQVLVNLLHNAIKFSDGGNRIILAAYRDLGSVVFSVEDFGTGIPEQDLDRIFERFYKTDQARSSGGTGLGLSIAKHIVEAHRGRIWVESSFNQGSRFFFSIPIGDHPTQ
ncbi:MAG: sensor histidine kinase [Anaerolineales bacterium]